MVQGSITQCAFVCQFFVSLCSIDQTAVLMKHLVTAGCMAVTFKRSACTQVSFPLLCPGTLSYGPLHISWSLSCISLARVWSRLGTLCIPKTAMCKAVMCVCLVNWSQALAFDARLYWLWHGAVCWSVVLLKCALMCSNCVKHVWLNQHRVCGQCAICWFTTDITVLHNSTRTFAVASLIMSNILALALISPLTAWHTLQGAATSVYADWNSIESLLKWSILSCSTTFHAM